VQCIKNILRITNKPYRHKTYRTIFNCPGFQAGGFKVRPSFTRPIDVFDKSDIDILISFKDISIEKYTDNYFELHYKLEELFNRKIDLLTENSLSNPYFIESIEETKQLLYAA
jgi:predicted nucleotidyltransferase